MNSGSMLPPEILILPKGMETETGGNFMVLITSDDDGGDERNKTLLSRSA